MAFSSAAASDIQEEMDAARTNAVIDVKDDNTIWTNQVDKSLEDNKAWVNILKKRAAEIEWPSHKCTIYRVPDGLRKVDPTAYEPQILSLGPYNHGKPHLRAMEGLKWRYLNRFQHRNSERGMEDYLKVVAVEEARTREAYSEAPDMDSKNWVEMMLLDSCFAVELLLTLKNSSEESNDQVADPILSTSWVRPTVFADMLLLENQLPFFLLEQLLELNSFPSRNSHSLAKIVLSVFIDLMPGKIQLSSLDSIYNIHHILHLLYRCMLPRNPAIERYCSRGLLRTLWSCCVDPLIWKFTKKNSSSSNSSSSSSSSSSSIFVSDEPSPLQRVASAKNLKNAGVVFRKKTNNVTSFMDITFRRGTFEIPQLQIFGQSNSLFHNLIAFEQCHVRNEHPTDLAAYAYLMDCIIDTPVDVDLLQQSGIIVSTLGNDDDVARFFNRLRTNAAIDEGSYLSTVFRDVQCHCDKKRNKWKASLNQNYFNNPWAISSVIAAIFLFLLTIAQTMLAFFTYLKPRSP